MAEIDQPRSFNAWASTSSPRVNMGARLLDLVGVRTASVDGAPPRLVDLAVVHPASQGWGISVIRSGESPVIGRTRRVTASSWRRGPRRGALRPRQTVRTAGPTRQ